MLTSYNSKVNFAQIGREFEQVRNQIIDALASTAMQKCLVIFKTDEKCTEAVIIFREQNLNLNISKTNHCREEKLYIPQKEIMLKLKKVK